MNKDEWSLSESDVTPQRRSDLDLDLDPSVLMPKKARGALPGGMSLPGDNTLLPVYKVRHPMTFFNVYVTSILKRDFGS